MRTTLVSRILSFLGSFILLGALLAVVNAKATQGVQLVNEVVTEGRNVRRENSPSPAAEVQPLTPSLDLVEDLPVSFEPREEESLVFQVSQGEREEAEMEVARSKEYWQQILSLLEDEKEKYFTLKSQFRLTEIGRMKLAVEVKKLQKELGIERMKLAEKRATVLERLGSDPGIAQVDINRVERIFQSRETETVLVSSEVEDDGETLSVLEKKVSALEAAIKKSLPALQAEGKRLVTLEQQLARSRMNCILFRSRSESARLMLGLAEERLQLLEEMDLSYREVYLGRGE